MITIIKKEGRSVTAYRLGDHGPVEQEMIAEKKIRKHPDGTYELFSSEAVNGAGELADTGDYFKVDQYGFPYPNKKDWFETNHRHRSGDEYEQIPKPLRAWMAGMPEGEPICYLLKSGKLTINEQDNNRYFNAFLYGAPLSAAKDAVIVFYDIKKNAAGGIESIDFGLVDRDVFEKTYMICE